MYDLLIVGGGAAGLTAAIYAARADLDFAVLEQDGYGGGQIQSTERVDNYPGLFGIAGAELAEQLVAHCQALEVPFLYQCVQSVQQTEGGFLVLTDGGTYYAKTVIFAAGTSHQTLQIPGEAALTGCGVSYCATCDGAFFEGKTVAVIGSGDTAVTEALYLSRIARCVHLIYRKATLKAAAALQRQFGTHENILLHPNSIPEEILGDAEVTGLRLAGGTVLPVDGVFVAIGTIPETGPLKDLGVCDPDGYITADETGTTAIPGLFAAGDSRAKPLRQVLTAAADGANCVVSAERFLRTL